VSDPTRSSRSDQTPRRQPLTGARSLAGMQTTRPPEYLVIGHICGDIQTDGSVVLGGTALYSAITAARLGWRTAVLTRGIYGREVAGYQIPSLEEYAGEVSIIVQDADTTTMFVNEYAGGHRTQKLPQWAGPIDLRGLPPHWRNARIIHLGPIAQEIDTKQTGSLTPFFLGATPQGWMRDWPKPTGGKVTHNRLRLPKELVSRLDCIIVSRKKSPLPGYRRGRRSQPARGHLHGQDGAKVIYGGQRAIFQLQGRCRRSYRRRRHLSPPRFSSAQPIAPFPPEGRAVCLGRFW